MVADIVAVNGQPAKGTLAAQAWGIGLTPAPNPGRSIADTRRLSLRYQTFEILKSDGTPVGTIIGFGPNGGAAPPGAPSAQAAGNLAIVGGTGAFLGARGQFGAARFPPSIPGRAASFAEDPANRRKNGGGSRRFILHVIPMLQPQVETGGGRGARAGEILTIFCTGLGPTRPGVDPGKQFPATPPAVVNSPVEVTVNGKPAEVLAAIGLAGAVDRYEVKFRVPPETVKGVATMQVSAAWVASTPATIRIQ